MITDFSCESSDLLCPLPSCESSARHCGEFTRMQWIHMNYLQNYFKMWSAAVVTCVKGSIKIKIAVGYFFLSQINWFYVLCEMVYLWIVLWYKLKLTLKAPVTTIVICFVICFVISKVIFANCGPRSDCLIRVHTVCLYAKIGLKSLQEYSADYINRRHFQMQFFLAL